MHELFDSIETWFEQGQRVALATVVSTWGSSPRRVGAKLAFTPAGGIAGSVSGGCIEGAVIEAGLAGLETGKPELLHFGVSDETAFSVGLACGGEIEVYVQELDEALFRLIRQEVEAGRPAALVTLLSAAAAANPYPPISRLTQPGDRTLYSQDGQVLFGKNDEDWVLAAQPLAELAMRSDQPERISLLTPAGSLDVFIDAILPPPSLVIVGGGHISIALASIAKATGYHTTLVDPRRGFATQERFPHVDRLFTEWPQEAFEDIPLTPNTAVALLTHDPKIDDPALQVVLESPAFYIGALGSRKTHAARLGRLRELGIAEDRLARIRGPVGLEIGAATPEEIALAIMAEIVATRRNKV